MSKIALVNGSPKGKSSASQILLDEFKSCLAGREAGEFLVNSSKSDCWEALLDYDVLVLFFPLYVDGIPSHLLSFMRRMERSSSARTNPLSVYAVCNCGFYEGIQCRHALDMVKHWCKKAGFAYRQGLGLGGGGMLSAIQNIPYGQGPRKNFSSELQRLAAQTAAAAGGDDRFASPNFPRFLYRLSAEMGWHQLIEKNGLKTRDLSLRR